MRLFAGNMGKKRGRIFFLERKTEQSELCSDMARLKGLEPLTYCLEGSCSIQLSYRRIASLLRKAAANNMQLAATWSG